MALSLLVWEDSSWPFISWIPVSIAGMSIRARRRVLLNLRRTAWVRNRFPRQDIHRQKHPMTCSPFPMTTINTLQESRQPEFAAQKCILDHKSHRTGSRMKAQEYIDLLWCMI
jgi:hypothetical protein